jgi:hypothetical protein
MVLEIFTTLVGVLAVIYAGFAKFIQNKLVDKSKVEGMQKRSKELNAEFKKAKEKGNQKEMDAIMKKQMAFLPEMNKVMLGQFKPMIFILVLFFAFTWVVGQIDPNIQDDIKIVLLDDGNGCDVIAQDGIYSACVTPENSGKWVANVKSFKNGAETGSNFTYFVYDAISDDTYTEEPMGNAIVASTDKKSYSKGETVKLFAETTDASSVEATLDSATSFRVDLPITIPILNVQRIYQPYWWFILISLIANLSLSLILSKLKKK